MNVATLDKRNQATKRGACGVRIDPGHALSFNVHAFQRWLTDSVLLTWCGVEVETPEMGKLTNSTISCSGCAQASLAAFREG